MRKYLQITIVTILFAGLVIARQIKGNDDTPVVGNSSNSSPIPTASTSSSTPTTSSAGTGYKDGTYTGSRENVFYGYFQVQATITNGKISDISFLEYPNDNRTSQFINQQAMSILRTEAITAQTAQVDIVSGASDSSAGFQRSLATALAQAK